MVTQAHRGLQGLPVLAGRLPGLEAGLGPGLEAGLPGLPIGCRGWQARGCWAGKACRAAGAAGLPGQARPAGLLCPGRQGLPGLPGKPGPVGLFCFVGLIPYSQPEKI